VTVEQAEVVDFISVDKSGAIVLRIGDHLEWSIDNHLFQLQAKVNSYLAFLEADELENEYPKAAGRPVRIEIVCKFPPDKRGLHF